MDIDSISNAIDHWKPGKHRRQSINKANQLIKKATTELNGHTLLKPIKRRKKW